MGGFFGRNFWEEFLGGTFWEDFFGGSYLNIKGMDLFVKILVFVKILQGSKEEGKFRFLEVRVQAYRT